MRSYLEEIIKINKIASAMMKQAGPRDVPMQVDDNGKGTYIPTKKEQAAYKPVKPLLYPHNKGPEVSWHPWNLVGHHSKEQIQELSRNNFKGFANVLKGGPKLFLMEVPITGGKSVAKHTQVTGFMGPADWEALPAREKAKWRSVPVLRDGEEEPVFFRTFSTSAHNDYYSRYKGSPSYEKYGQSIPDSSEGDWFIANTLLGSRDAEVRPFRYLNLSSSYPRTLPAPITYYRYDEDSDTVKPFHFDAKDRTQGTTLLKGTGTGSGDTWDTIASLAPSNIAELELYEDRLDDNGDLLPARQTLNDALNAGEEISNIVANNRWYNLGTNNCHYGTIFGVALNPYVRPGSFGSGGARGFSMDSDDASFDKYRHSTSPFLRWGVRFHVDQRNPSMSTEERWAKIRQLQDALKGYTALRKTLGLQDERGYGVF